MSARVGVLILVLLFVVAVGATFFAIAMLGRTPTVTRAKTMLVWDVPYELPETEPSVRLFSLALGNLRPRRPTVFTMTNAIRRAAGDDQVRAMVLHVDGIGWGWARIEEVRDALLEFRASGKPLYATLTAAGEREYLLASAAGTVGMPPTYTLQLDGLAAGAMFFRGTLDKLGISPNFEHVGRYKSAVEQYTRKELSTPAREAEDAVIDDIYGAFIDGAAADRDMDATAMRRLVEAGPYGADEARALGLVDTVLFDGQMDSLAAQTAGKDLPATDLVDYAIGSGSGSGRGRIALVYAVGTIAPGKSSLSPYDGQRLGAETLIDALRDVSDDRSIDAIVLRVDSPGGSATASDDILHELQKCGRRLPIVVSMGDLAASGGYYISLAADSIVAQAATQTGSIGIFGGKLNIRGLYEKLGLSVDLLTRGPNSTILSPFTDWDENQRRIFHAQLESFYQRFVANVAENRGLSIEEADSLGRGRVWSGAAAQERGLVDAIGGLDRAFRMAKSLAGLDPDRPAAIVRFPRVHRSFMTDLIADLFSDEDSETLAPALPAMARAWLYAARLPAGTPLAIMPWSVEAR